MNRPVDAAYVLICAAIVVTVASAMIALGHLLPDQWRLVPSPGALGYLAKWPAVADLVGAFANGALATMVAALALLMGGLTVPALAGLRRLGRRVLRTMRGTFQL